MLLLLPLLRTVALVCYYYCHLVRQPLKVVDSVGKVLPEAGHLRLVVQRCNVPTHPGQCCREGVRVAIGNSSQNWSRKALHGPNTVAVREGSRPLFCTAGRRGHGTGLVQQRDDGEAVQCA